MWKSVSARLATKGLDWTRS